MNRSVACSCVILLSAAAGMTLGGPLTPPVGPVGSTMKTLVEVEPRTAINAANTPGDGIALFKITQPGSYYLTGNITGVSGLSGILIATGDVTIDLNGFELKGVPGSNEGVAVVSLTTLYNLCVKNGTVRAWGGAGINLTNGSCSNQRVEKVRASHNGGAGVSVGHVAVVTGCVCTYNAGPGVGGQSECRVTDCVTENNSAHGYYLENRCSISGCVAVGNNFNGIIVDDGSTVIDCTVSLNKWDGIRVSDACRVSGNMARDNGALSGGGAGIHATGTNNRIEGNNCVGADIGVDVDAAGNFIIKNTCSDNTTNWSVAAGNVCYVVSALVGGAIIGNNGGTSLGTSESNANFTY